MRSKNIVLISGACLLKENKGKQLWFLVRQQGEEKWELPKVPVRKGESSVRAILRAMGERGGMGTRVLEEVGRAGGITTVNGKILPQRFIYYLMTLRSSSSESIGFPEYNWFEFPQTLKELSSKREKLILKAAKKEFEKWEKIHRRKKS